VCVCVCVRESVCVSERRCVSERDCLKVSVCVRVSKSVCVSECVGVGANITIVLDVNRPLAIFISIMSFAWHQRLIFAL